MTDPAGASGPILSLGPVDALVPERLRAFGPVIVAGPGDTAFAQLVGSAIGLIARGTSIVDAALIDAAAQLRVIGRSGIGVELVDLDAATARGIPVVVTPGAGTNAVAEGALAMILHLAKRLGPLTELVREDRWAERESVPVGDLEGATLGIVGFGRIGQRLAVLAAVIGMRIVAFDPYADPALAATMDVDLIDLGSLAARADVISLHAPLTPATKHVIDAAFLAQVRPGTILVNCGRGGLLDLDAVHAALECGGLAGVGLDVFEPEPPPVGGHPIFRHPSVVLTPHVLGLSALGRRRIFEDMADGMAAVLAGRRAPQVANPAVYERR